MTGKWMPLLILSLFLSTASAEPATTLPDAILRDANICPGPDGTYYLTGTTPLTGKDGKPDFNNNRGVHVWSSKDLKQWSDLGFVWDLWKDPSNHAHGQGGSAWQTELYPVPGLPPGERGRGMTAPRLTHDGHRFWITFSMNGYAAGAMPGCTDVKGPYKDTLLLAETGGAPTDKSDAVLFVDRDGTRYLLWGGGCLAKLKEPGTLEALKANESGVEGPVQYLPAMIEGFAGDDGLPDRGAPYGPFLFHDGTNYQFLFTATTLRDGGIHEDSYICSAKELPGPYSKPRPLVADSGRVTTFKGPGGKWHLAWSGTDPKNAEFEKPAIQAFPPREAKAFAAGAPKPKRGEIAGTVPLRKPAEHPKNVKQLLDMIEPLMDHPLRDASICRGPDKTWYLIGTEATRGSGKKAGNAASVSLLDWSNNNGIRLWSSSDRKTWRDCGYVWDIDRDASKSPKSAWQMESHLDLTLGAKPLIGRAMSAPEIVFAKGTFWIVYSMNGSGIGLLKSSNGKAEGPYEDFGRVVTHGRDGSLFEDKDGTVNLVWGQGFYAPMKDDMTGLSGPVKTFFTNTAWYPRYLRRPENMGQWGSHLIKAGDWYVWTFTTRTGRLGINSIDTMASWSKSLDGPWGEPCLMLANGGQSTLVSDGDGGYLATVSGEDEYSQWPYRAAITPVVSEGGAKGGGLILKEYAPQAVTTDFHAVNSLQATALDLWIGHPDLIPCTLRDVCVTQEHDGFYYATGSFWGVEQYRRDVVLFRSPDKLHWEAMPPVYTATQFREIPGFDVTKLDEFIQKDDGKNRKFQMQIGENHVQRIGDTYYIMPMQFSGLGGNMLIKSLSGKIEGPYRGIRDLPSTADVTVDDDGTILLQTGDSLIPFKNAAEFETLPRKDFAGRSLKIEVPGNICFSEDCEVGIMRINGKYVHWSTDWTGSYDAIYHWADSYKGPWKGDLRILPYGGNGRFFRDGDGSWWYAYFMNNNDYATRAQNLCRMDMYPLFVGMENGELIIEPRALRENRSRLEKMGGLWFGKPR